MKFKLKFPRSSSSAPKGPSRKKLSTFLFTGTAAILLLTYLIYIPQPKTILDNQLKVGDIVKNDIIIKKDLTVEDEESTRLKRKKAMAAVVPIYEYNIENKTKTRDMVDDWFNLVRIERKKYIKNNAELDKIKKEIETKMGLEIPGRDLRYIFKRNLVNKIDLNTIQDFFRSLTAKRIIPSKVGARRSKQNTIKVAVKGGEPVSLKLDSVYDLNDAQVSLEKFLSSQTKALNSRDISVLLPILKEFIDVNTSYSVNLTQEEETRVTSQINPVVIKLKAGKVILRKGDEVKPEHLKIFKLIAAAENTRERKISNFYLIAFILVFMALFGNKYFKIWKSSSINRKKLFVVIGATLIVSAGIYRASLFLFPLVLKNISFQINYDGSSIFYAIPFGFGALIIAFTFTLQSAVIYSFINSIIGGIICNWDFRIMLYIVLGNLAVSYGIEFYQRLKRSPIIKAGMFWLMPVNVISVLLFNLTEPYSSMELILTNVSMAIFSALIALILANFIIPLWEIFFNLITELKLIELTNLNLPIFREMLEKAPGTYHHSQMVASLAEAAALQFDISPLLLTAMALYHDIGKIENPHLFIENHTLYPNPHKKLSARESAKNIIAHIPDGMERASKIKLPEIVASSIAQHHGNKLIHFFYDKAKEMSSIDSDEFDEKFFRYQGVKPQSIENAIIMLADQVEAACKSLASPTDEEIKNVIQEIINVNIEENQFDECEGLTFKALNMIAGSFHQKLTSIYHMRISYPGFDFSDKKEKEEDKPS